MKKTNFPRWILVFVSAAIIVSGCAPSPSGLDANSASAEPQAETGQSTADPTEEAASDTATEAPQEPSLATEVEPTIEATPDSGDVPMTPSDPDGSAPAGAPADLISNMVADLASRLGIDPSQITVASATAMTWSDGSLGCPQPGQMYTQALVPGFKVILVAGGKPYPYHASERGGFKLCQQTPGVPRVQPGDPSK